MLPNHQPLVVAEQFGVLESLFPGRIDMGLGRSVGFTDGVRKALGRDKDDADDFAGQLDELLGWFRGTSPTGVHARPAEGLTVPPFVLAMGEGATIAARAGLPMVIGDLRNREKMRRGIDHYRASFRPSPWSAEPYVVISGTIAVAATPEEARRLLVPEAWSMAYSRTHGTFPPLPPAERVEALTMSGQERGFYESGLTGQLAGTEDQVAHELETVLKETGAQEVLVTTSTYDREALRGLLPTARADRGTADRRLARIGSRRLSPLGRQICTEFPLMPDAHDPRDAPGAHDPFVRVRGAREHNLQGVDVDIPRDVLTVFTGVSGSGKSSLAFGTIYAEAQRRYFESVAPYARRLIHQVGAPKVG